jgi:WD40 repeat protein
MSKLIDLGLDADEDHPRRLVALPKDDKHLLAFGGNDGTISLVELESSKVRTARQFDDAVRDVAFSHDGKRVAVGLDDGSTQIFLFADIDAEDSLHPFVIHKADDEFLSQNESETSFQGPRFDAPVRALQWDPRSNMLAIASEAGMCVVDATSKNSISTKDRFLQESADKEHSNAGVRGLSYHSEASQTLLASLGLDGRLCVWDVTGDDPALDYELLHRDNLKCIPKADVGELNGSDALDRSCLPVFGKTILSLPGKTDVQLRSVSKLEQQAFLPSVDAKGHIEPIVAIALSDDDKNIVTSGRDGRVNLWNIEKKVTSCRCLICKFD